jgi:hypothetical protein
VVSLKSFYDPLFLRGWGRHEPHIYKRETHLESDYRLRSTPSNLRDTTWDLLPCLHGVTVEVLVISGNSRQLICGERLAIGTLFACAKLSYNHSIAALDCPLLTPLVMELGQAGTRARLPRGPWSARKKEIEKKLTNVLTELSLVRTQDAARHQPRPSLLTPCSWRHLFTYRKIDARRLRLLFRLRVLLQKICDRS